MVVISSEGVRNFVGRSMRSSYAPQAERPASRAPGARTVRDSRPVRPPGPISHEELDAAVRRFKKAIIERALGGELTHHLGYPPGGSKPEATTNHRNGTSGKTVLAATDRSPSMSRVTARVRSSRG
jgi:hypothetical protein